MGNRWALGCHHLSHPNIYGFKNEDGSLLRPWASSCEEGDEMMIDAHNKVVGKKDTVYFMGDVAIQRRGLALLSRMQGEKVLIGGNHDIFKLKDYLPYFKDIRAQHKINHLILSHTPIHRGSIPKWSNGNVHAHLHNHVVRMNPEDPTSAPDPLYFSTCVERVGLTPVPIEQIEAQMAVNRDYQIQRSEQILSKITQKP